MKMWFVFPLLAAAVVQAEGPAAKPAGSPAQSISIPAAAVETSPNLYRYTDADGKIWFYRHTPFGVVRFQEQPVAEVKPEPDGIRAMEDGQTVRFERLGPFGIYHWTRNKSELDPGEQAALERERAR